MTALDLPTLRAIPTDPQAARDAMPKRLLNMSFHVAGMLTGVILTTTGLVIQSARHAMHAPMFAMQQPQPTDIGEYGGMAITLAGAAVTVFTLVGKGLIDLYLNFRAKRMDLDKLEMEQRLEIEQRAADNKAKAEAQDRKMQLDQLAKMAEQLGLVRAELADAREETLATRERLDHANNNVKQLQATNTQLLLRIEESSRNAASSARAAEVSSARVEAALGSSDEIAATG